MGRKRASKNKNCIDNVGKTATKEPMEAVASGAKFKRAGEENGTDKSSDPGGKKVERPCEKEALQGEISSKKGTLHVDVKDKDLTHYKNKCSSLKSTMRDLEKKIDLNEIIIKQKAEENAVLKAEISQLSTNLTKLQTEYENLKKENCGSEPIPMEVDPIQGDTLDHQIHRETDVECQSFWNQRHIPASWDDDDKPGKSLGAEQGRELLYDEERGTLEGAKQFSTPSTTKHMRGSSCAKEPSKQNRDFGGKYSEIAKQPSISSYHGLSSNEKHHRRESRPDFRGRGYDYVEQGHHNICRGWQARQGYGFEQNQNYRIARNSNSGRLKLEMPAEYKIVKEVEGDLFEAPENNSLAHCVAEDMAMGSGIAITFRQMFKCVDELLEQGKRQGDVAVLENAQRYIYYLVTKRISTGKPTMDTLQRSLKAMRDHVEKHNVTQIAMPRIGCGLDRLDWDRVKPLIENVFSGLDLTITVYNYRKDNAASKPSYNNYIIMKEASIPVVNIEEYTAILCLCAEDGSVDPVLESLDKKFCILSQFHSANKKLGTVFEITRGHYLICFLFVKKKKDDVLSFKMLAQSLVQARKIIDKQGYGYVALEAFHDEHDDIVLEKVITVLKNYLNMKPKKEMWLCWPDNIPRKHNTYFYAHT